MTVMLLRDTQTERRICLVCGKDSFKLINATNGGDYLKCRNCGLESQCTGVDDSETQRRFEEEQQKYYGAHSMCFAPAIKRLHQQLAQRRIRVLQQYLPAGRIIEVGPGTGDVMILARDAGYEVEGVEQSAVLAEAIREASGLTVYEEAVEQLAEASNRYDACLTFHVVEHVTDPVDFLAKIATLVHDGGYVLIATPNADSWEQRLMANWAPNYSTAHLHLFSKASLQILLERTGWEIVDLRTNSYANNWLRVFTNYYRRLRPKHAAPRGAVAANMSSRRGRILLETADILLKPLTLLQDFLGSGNELAVVARKKP